MATTEDIQRRIVAFASELAKEMGPVDPAKGVCWFDAIENQAVEIGDAVMTELAKQLAADAPQPDGEDLCPKCGKQSRYDGNRPRELITRRGPVEVMEPKYYCPACRQNFFPSGSGDRS